MPHITERYFSLNFNPKNGEVIRISDSYDITSKEFQKQIFNKNYYKNDIKLGGDAIAWEHVLTTIPDIKTIDQDIVNGAYSYFTEKKLGVICPSIAGFLRFEIPLETLNPWLSK